MRIGDLFRPGTAVWGFGAGLLQPIFRGGELEASRRAEVAGYDQAAAQYRETVLQAFRDVADVLRALEYDAMTLKAQAEAEAAARDTLDIAKKQVRYGATSYLSLLNAQREYHLARILLVQAQALRFADTAALFQALGGGWWNREPESGRTGTYWKPENLPGAADDEEAHPVRHPWPGDRHRRAGGRQSPCRSGR